MIVSLASLKDHLGIAGEIDDVMLGDKLAAAEAHVAAFVGKPLDTTTFPDGIPAPLSEAVRQLAAHLYENREAVQFGERGTIAPLGVFDLVGPYRTFGF